MAYAPIRIYGPAQPATSGQTLYTSTGTTVIKEIHLTNGTTGTRAVSLGIGGITNALLFMNQLSIQGTTGAGSTGNNYLIIPCSIVLAASQTIQGLVDTASSVNVMLNAEYSTG